MTRCLCLLLLASLISPSFAAERLPEPLVRELKTPSAAVTGSDGRVYVATLGDSGKDGDGEIIVVEQGRTKSFTTGLDDPRGLAARAEWLYVADKDRVWRIDRNGKAKVFASAEAFTPKAKSLRGMDIDELGRIYVADAGSDGKGGAIYRLDPNGKVSRITDAIAAPTAVALDGLSYLMVLDAATGRLLRLRLVDGTMQRVADHCGGGGLVWDKFGRLYGSDGAARVFVVPRPGDKAVSLTSDFQSAAALALSPDGKAILVVDAKAGTITALPAQVPGEPVDERPLSLQAVVAFPHLKWTGWEPISESGKTAALRPLVLTHAGDGSNRIFVATQRGIVHAFPNDQKATKTSIFLDIHERVYYNDNENEQGLLGLAFHPKYKENGELFVFYTPKKIKTDNVLSRFRVRRDDANRVDPDSEEELLRISRPYWNHDGGTLCFGPDGYLYVALGDGGFMNDPHGNGQNLKTLLGKILRLNVDKKGEKTAYSIPEDNPFVGQKDARPEIWAYGLRNVWRMAFDRKTGALWAADVGQNLYEEINLIVRGGNYGWNRREALHPFGARGADVEKQFIDPIWEYHHDIGKSITGGSVYRGQRFPELQGFYLYADYVSTKIWALRYEEKKRRVVTNRAIRDPNVPVMSFGEDEKGEIYFLTYTNTGQGIYWFVKDEAERKEK